MSVLYLGKFPENILNWLIFGKQLRQALTTISLKGVTGSKRVACCQRRKTRVQYSPKRSRFGLGRYRSEVYRQKVRTYQVLIVEVFPAPLKIKISTSLFFFIFLSFLFHYIRLNHLHFPFSYHCQRQFKTDPFYLKTAK